MDESVYLDHRNFIDEHLRIMTDNFAKQVDRMLNNENYIEKYMPIYIQRQNTETCEQVLKRT